MEEFEDQVPPTTRFSVEYFEGQQSTKKWLVTQEDLAVMYSVMRQSGKTDVCWWCDGYSQEGENHESANEIVALVLHQSVRRKSDDLVAELKEMHVDQHSYSDPQYRLWARMITNGIHASKETPPQVPMITGVTPTRRTRSSMEDTAVATTVSAAMGSAKSPQPQQNVSALPSHCASLQGQSNLGVLPGKAIEIRGKCFAQLASPKQLFKYSVLTEEETKEQKSSILTTLRKLS